jgi:hypothetical protein
MSLSRTCFLTAAALAFGIASAADMPPPPTDDKLPKAAPAPKMKKKVKMDEPMAGGMKKPGMMKGDMKSAADQKDRKMDEMMKKEEKASK